LSVWKAKSYRIARVDAQPEVLEEAARYLRNRGISTEIEGRVLLVEKRVKVHPDGRVEGNPVYAFLLPLAACKLALAYSLGRSIYLNHSAAGFGKRGRAVAEVSLGGKLIELKYTDAAVPIRYEEGMSRLGFELVELKLGFPKPMRV